MIELVHGPDLLRPGGHYSHAAATDGLVFTAGQLPVLPDGTIDVAASFAVQTERAFDNVFKALAAAGCSKDDVVKFTAYIVDSDHWPEFNRVYAEAFGDHRPARTVVPVPSLHFGFLVEVEAIAARPSRA